MYVQSGWKNEKFLFRELSLVRSFSWIWEDNVFHPAGDMMHIPLNPGWLFTKSAKVVTGIS